MKSHASVYFVLTFVLAACVSMPPAANTLPAPPAAQPTVTEAPSPNPQPTPRPTATLKYGPPAATPPDPKADPTSALRYSDFPAGLGSVMFSSRFAISADPSAEYENAGYGLETARSFGRLDIVDFGAGRIDMDVHINYSIGDYGQDLHVTRLGERAWVRTGGWQWGAVEAAELDADGWVRMGWGGWHPLYMLEPFDSVTEVKWVEDGLLDGEPAHHLHVAFDPNKMQHLSGSTKVRYEYQWTSLWDGPYYGDPTLVDVQAEVWLDAKELEVRQIETTIKVVTQEDESGKGKTNWTIAKAIQFKADEPGAIAAASPARLPAVRGMTNCSRVNEIPKSECQALVAFHKAVGGNPWTNQGGQGWLAGDHPCDWGGVTCWGGHVVWLILPEMKLSGPLPPEVSELPKLQVLYLQDNNLTGPVSPELGGLVELRALDLSSNWELTGALPSEIGNLPGLQELKLSLSGLSGPLPETFKNLKLTLLDIGASDLCVPDDPSFRDWVHSIGNLGLSVSYAGEDEIYCKDDALPAATPTPEVLTRAPTVTATPLSEKNLYWQRYDVDIGIQQSGDMRITETQELVFTSGTFRWGQREIPFNRLSDIKDIAVSEEGGPTYTESSSGEAYTYSVTRDEEYVKVRYNFPPSADSRRTVVIAYTVVGALRYYPDSGVDQLFWKAIPAGNPFQTMSSVITVHVPEPAVFTNYGLYGVESEMTFQPGLRDVAIQVSEAVAAGQEVEVVAEWQHGVVAGTPQPWQEELDQGH